MFVPQCGWGAAGGRVHEQTVRDQHQNTEFTCFFSSKDLTCMMIGACCMCLTVGSRGQELHETENEAATVRREGNATDLFI